MSGVGIYNQWKGVGARLFAGNVTCLSDLFVGFLVGRCPDFHFPFIFLSECGLAYLKRHHISISYVFIINILFTFEFL